MAEPCGRVRPDQRTHQHNRQNHQQVAESAEQLFTMAARGNRPNHTRGAEVGFEHYCCNRAPEQEPIENQRSAVSAVHKIECRSRVESRGVGEGLRRIWQDADYLGSVRKEIGSAKIRRAVMQSFLLDWMRDRAACPSWMQRPSLVWSDVGAPRLSHRGRGQTAPS